MQRLPNLITSLHTQGVGRSSWQQFADDTSDLFDADGCLFCFREIQRPEHPILHSTDKLGGSVSKPISQLLLDSPVGRILTDGDISTAVRDDNQSRVLAATAYRDDKYEAILSIVRKKERIEFGQVDQQLLNEFLPYIKSVVEGYFHQYIAPQDADISALLQHFSDNLVVIDDNAQIQASNDAFNHLKLSKCLLYVYGGTVHFYQKALQQWFDAFLSNEHQPAQSSVYRITELEQPVVLKLSVFQLKQPLVGVTKSRRFLLSIDNFDAYARFKQYKQLFQLTKAEAELAAYLSLGKTLNQLASQKLLSKHTLRTQLKSVFMKTETHSQNELIVLLKNVV
ncbi:MAG: helix-turn-helix transcriptional regulator [Algicola sp.]|nr:helix-turn-helix transcriptional regulator [Algicola sp.]